MKNNYIKLYMNQNKEFRTHASLTLFGTHFTNVNVKIDTGCGTTTILATKLGIPKSETQKLKKQDCIDTSIQLSCISFFHRIQDFKIAGTLIENIDVKVNYDRTGNILIGMDVISTWDTHIGTLTTGETLLLACPKKQLNFEYYDTLQKFFNLKPTIMFS